jgi:hypothetical protein
MSPGYIVGYPGFREIGEAMMAPWDQGLNGQAR